MSVFGDLLQRAMANYEESMANYEDRMRERLDRLWGKRDPEKEWRGLESLIERWEHRA